MNRFMEKLNSFMYGRYGRDQLGTALIVLWILCAAVNIFVGSATASLIIWLIGDAAVILCIFRMLSRNITRRRIENEKFLKIQRPAAKKLKNAFTRIKEFRTHCYFKCPACKSTLRVPRISGSHTVACPKCGNKFPVKIHLNGKFENK